MKSKKRFMALLLATVLVCSQVGTIGSPVTAEETELTTEAEEITAASDKTDGTTAEGAVSDSAGSTIGTTDASDDTAAAADTMDASDGATNASDVTADAANTGSADTSEAVTESTATDTAEDAADGSTEATTGAVSDAEEESEDETDTETIEDANDGISLAGLDLDGSSVDGGDDDEEDDISLTSEDEESDVEVKEVEYWFNYDWIDGTSTTLNGETIRLYISSVEQRVVYSDGEEEWDEYDEITDFTLDYSSTGRYTDLSIEEAEDGGYYISFTGKRQGGEDTVIISAIDEERYELTTEYFYVRVAEEYYVLTYDNGTIPTDDFRIGDTYTLNNDDFTLTRYCTDGEGVNYSEEVEIDGEEYWLEIEEGSFDTNALEIMDEGNSSVLRKTSWDTDFWVQVWYGEDDWLNDTRVRVGSYEISTKLTTTYGVEDDPTYYYVFDGYPQTITVSMEDDSDFPENTSIDWYVEIPDEVADYVDYTDNEDGSITFTVAEDIPEDYREGYTLYVEYNLRYGDTGDSFSGIGADSVEILKEYEEYNTAGDEVHVVGEGYDLYSFYAYVRDYDHPYGTEADIVYGDISIENQYEYNDDGDAVETQNSVIELSGDSESGWHIQALKFGYAELEATYTDLNGDEQTCSFIVYVEGERYYLNWAYLEDQWNILVDEKITIDTSLECVYTNENGDADSYTIEDYTNQGYYLYYEYDEDILSIDIINGPYEDVKRVLSVTGVSEGGCDIHVFVTDDEDGENIIAEDYIWVNVTSEWYQLTADPENVGLGETVDLSALDYELTRYYTDENGDNQTETIEIDNENYRVVMADYEDNCWKTVEDTEEELLPELTRIGVWGGSVAVVAQYYDEGDKCWYDLWDWCWIYEEISYDSSLTAAYDGVETSNLIVGEAASVTLEEYLKNDYAFPDGYVVEYSVYIEEGWEDAYEYATWSVKDNVLALTAKSDEYTYVVCATAYYEDIEFSYAELYLSATEESVTYYAEADAWRILKGASTTLHAYQIEYSKEYPEGEVTELQITKVEAMKPSWSGDDDLNLSIFSFDVSDATEDGLEVTGVDEGWRCMYIYATVDGEYVRCGNMDEDERYIYIEVTSGYYYLDLEDSYTISLQDPTITLSEILHRTYVDEDEETVDEPVGLEDLSDEQAYISFSYSDEDGEEVISYAEDIISPSANEDGTITIEGLKEGETELLIAVYGYNEEGEKYEITEEWIMVYVQEKNDAVIYDADTGEAAETEYTVAFGDEFNLNLDTNSDNEDGIQYKVVEGTDVVTVDKDGKVTVTGVGTAVIKAWVEEGDTYYETEITITVVGEKADVTFLYDDDVTKTYGEDTSFTLPVKADNSESELTYKSSDESVVTVDSDGKVTVVGAGTAVITVSAEETDYFKEASTEISVTVNKADAEITVGADSYSKFTTDDAFSLGAAVTSDADLTYASSDEDVVSVSADGTVTIVGEGTATITISAGATDNYNAPESKTVTVTVSKAAASITPATSTQTVTYGQSIVLSAANLGLTVVGDGTLTYTVTSDTGVLSINGTTATTLKAGTAVITVSMAATDKYNAADDVTITVTVNKADGTGSVTLNGWVAGEDANTPTVTSATNGTDSVTFYYKVTGADDSTYTTTVPTTAGSYTVKAVFAATDCYNEVSATCDFTILDLSGYVKYDTNVTSLDDITLPSGWAWVSGQEIISGAINYVQAENTSTGETITVPVALIPHITSDDTFTKNVDTSAVIKCSGDLNYFKQVAVDGTVVETTNYTATSGSTILTFTEDYMNSLSVGEHTVALTYESGTVTGTLTVLTQSSGEETETETDTEVETETETETDTEEATEATTTASSESETTGSDSVSTGDETPIATTLAVMLLAEALLIAGAAYRRMYGRRK